MSAQKSADPRAAIRDLIAQREKLRGWITKLDAVRTDAPDRVAEKIRGDYEGRLAGVIDELSGHRDDIEKDLAAKQEEMRTREEQRTAAADALEETRLRHVIGELEDRDWEKSRPSLEGDVSSAEEELTRVRGEVDELTGLLAEISDATARSTAAKPKRGKAADAAAEPKPLPEPIDLAAALEEQPSGGDAAADDAELPWLDDLEKTMNAWDADVQDGSGLEFLDEVSDTGAAEPADAAIEGDELAFLAEIDAAIAGSAGSSAPETPPAAPGPDAAGGEAKAAPLTCKDCGAANEAHAWYCEVCGTEL